jgi:hypothetical protein
MYVSIYLNDNLTPYVKIVSSARTVVLNQIQWFILLIRKDHIPKDVMHELGDSRHTMDSYHRQIRITSDDVQFAMGISDGIC